MSELQHITPIIGHTDTLDDGVILTIRVPADLDYFKGHFPGQPILAGVVQLDWAIGYGLEHLAMGSDSVERVEVLKFQVIIPPDTLLTLRLDKKSAHKFTFVYDSALGTHSSGRVVLNGE